MTEPISDDHPASPPQSQRASRRPMLLALLLCALLALLWARPDLRRPGIEWSQDTAQHIIFDILGLSPRTIFEWRLRLAGLYDRPLGQAWRAAPRQAQQQATPIRSRIATRLNLPTERIEARVLDTRLQQGEALQWRLRRDSEPADNHRRLYATLERHTEHGWRNLRVLAADNHAARYVADAAGRYRLLFQPELAAGFHGALAISQGGSLSFPVVGGHLYDIGGGFGVPRDGGARRHHGVDIFAARDTPVRAVADGHVRLGNGGLGGRHIWLSGGLLGSPRFYYAHLNRFAVDSGSQVRKGDVIGYVGNTGNARGGPTHLHFGIYTAGGAIDPAPFIQPMPALPALPRPVTGH